MTPRRARAGFTLIEVIVALGIMALIASMTWAAMAGTFSLRDYLDEQDSLDRSARVAISRLTRELSLAFLTENTTSYNTYRTVFVGEDNDDEDQLWFSTMSHRRAYRGTHECDQAEVTLFTDEDPEFSGRRVLLHRESPRVDNEPDQDGVVLPLATSVSRFDLRYLDPKTGEWRDDWDTQGTETPNRLPRAVQIVLTLVGPDPDDEDRVVEYPYVTTVLVARADRLSRTLLGSEQ